MLVKIERNMFSFVTLWSSFNCSLLCRLFQGCSFYCTKLKLCKKMVQSSPSQVWFFFQVLKLQFCTLYFTNFFFKWILDQFKSIYDLLSSWQKIELDSWPALLDEVMDQYENNAGEVSGEVFFSIFCYVSLSQSREFVVIFEDLNTRQVLSICKCIGCIV